MIETNQEGMSILDLACGMNSFMSLLSLNMYNYLILEKRYPDVSSLFHEMMIFHMKSLDVMLKLAIKFNMDPRLWSCQSQENTYWSPCFNNYPHSYDALIENALICHQTMMNKLNNYLNIISHPPIKETIQSIIKEENKYLTLLSSFIES